MCHQQISAEILVAIASAITEEAVLTANKVKAWINLRETPSEIGKYLGYGLVGDHVQIIAQATVDNYIWLKSDFLGQALKAGFAVILSASPNNASRGAKFCTTGQCSPALASPVLSSG